MARRPYRKNGGFNRAYKPHKSTAANLVFKPCYRCFTCGKTYTTDDCLLIFKSKKPTQCGCGSITFDFFHSTAEARRYAFLLLMQSRGKISNLRKQVKFPLYTVSPEGLKTKVCDYVADFEYDNEAGVRVVNDEKGGMTPIAELKGKWFKAQHGFDILYTQTN